MRRFRRRRGFMAEIVGPGIYVVLQDKTRQETCRHDELSMILGPRVNVTDFVSCGGPCTRLSTDRRRNLLICLVRTSDCSDKGDLSS